MSFLSQIANNFVDAFNSLVGNNAGAPSKRYPTNFSNRPITNKPQYQSGSWRDAGGYEFHVVRAYPDGKTENADGWLPFRLQINPQELSQDEIFAIEVTPTFRGVLVEHHGTVLKDIVISGTTGISPKAREGGRRRSDGAPVLASGHSGYEEFHELRSYFRSYVESKRIDIKDDKQTELRMVFKNLKDNENLFVEPQKFSMRRSKSRPMLYDYTIALKGIGVAEVVPVPNSALGRFTNLLDSIQRAFDYIEYGSQILSGGIGILRRTERDITSAILTPLQRVNDALRAIRGGQEAFLGAYGITRRFIQNIKNEIERVEDNFNDVLGRNTAQYNQMKGRNPTIQGTSRESTFTETQILNGIAACKKGLIIILAERRLFEESIAEEKLDIQDIYKEKLQLPDINASRQVRILGNDTLQTIAARELGDPDRYRELIILNNLKPPYLDTVAAEGVLKIGDNILLPSVQATTEMGVRRNIDYNITKFLSETEKNFGVDIRVTEDYDLSISNTRDIDLVAGIENMSQAVLLKLFLEPGSLKRHRQIGADLQIGEKSVELGVVRNQVVNSLSSDSRVETIPFVGLEQEGNQIVVNLVLTLRKLNQPVGIPIRLNL